MKIKALTGALGAEITDIDTSRVSDSLISDLQAALVDHSVLAIRNQALSPADLMALTEALGGKGETPYLKGLTDYPDVVPIIKEAAERSPHTFGAGWHTDFTFQEKPPALTLLYAVDTPPVGGDTLYCNLNRAYRALSTGLQHQLQNLNAVHSAVRSYGPSATLKDHLEHMEITNDPDDPIPTIHPVIRKHPTSGQPALWVNPTYTIHFENMTEAESAPLLDFLNSHAVNPGFCCRVNWQPGTLTIWDNRNTQHCATSDYAGHRREMWRTTVAGEPPIAFHDETS